MKIGRWDIDLKRAAKNLVDAALKTALIIGAVRLIRRVK